MNERIARIARQKKGREQKRKMEGTNDGEREREKRKECIVIFFEIRVKRGEMGRRNCRAENNFHERWRVGVSYGR